jgi:nitroreductase
MEFWETVTSRHSIRDFSQAEIPSDVLHRLIEAALLAPSAMNLQPWKFWVLQGQSRTQMGEIVAQSTVHLSEYMDVLGPKRYEAAVSWYSSLGNAPVLVAVTAPRMSAEFENMNRNLSIGAAIENLLLAVTNEGLGACNVTFSFWVKGEMGDVLGLTDAEEIVAIVAVGVPSDVPPAAPPVKTDDTVWLD